MTRPLAVATVLAACMSASLFAHNGPPFPILSDRRAGPYNLSIWTDPDATDDGSAAGQFWVRLKAQGPIPDDTRVMLAIRPLDREGRELAAEAVPVRGDRTNQFVALVMDHEGPFAVRVRVTGALGAATAEAETNATYDLRPAPFAVVVYAVPFVLAGALWGAMIMRRRRAWQQRPPKTR